MDSEAPNTELAPRPPYCRNCGKSVTDQAIVCTACGAAPRSGGNFCQNCAAATNPNQEVCLTCGVRLVGGGGVAGSEPKSKIVAGILGILLGGLGIHRFYLGYTTIGIIQLALGLGGLLTCGITSIVSWIWGLVEGIMILMGTMNTDAQGRPLKE
jgi:TM2 domain-containing membrane protein YozV